MEKLLNKIQEQLDNDWAVEAKDIRRLMFYALINNRIAEHNRRIANERGETTEDLLAIISNMLEEYENLLLRTR